MTCPACVDRWNWVAVYKDGNQILECDDSGYHRGFNDVDRNQLLELCWIPAKDPNDRILIIDCSGDGTYSAFRQRAIKINPVTGINTDHVTFHCVGVEKDNSSYYTFMSDLGHILVSHDMNAAVNSIQ